MKHNKLRQYYEVIHTFLLKCRYSSHIYINYLMIKVSVYLIPLNSIFMSAVIKDINYFFITFIYSFQQLNIILSIKKTMSSNKTTINM